MRLTKEVGFVCFFIIVKTAIILITLILFINLNNSSYSKNLNLSSEQGDPTIIYVDDSNLYGPWDGTIENPYMAINDAINNCTNGDTISVFNGTYFEKISINNSINLIGENKKTTIIDGQYTVFLYGPG